MFVFSCALSFELIQAVFFHHQGMRSEGSSRSNLEKLKVPWDVRSGTSVADFDNLAPTNDYTMDEELGVGGFGTVYRGTKKTNGTEVPTVPTKTKKRTNKGYIYIYIIISI